MICLYDKLSAGNYEDGNTSLVDWFYDRTVDTLSEDVERL